MPLDGQRAPAPTPVPDRTRRRANLTGLVSAAFGLALFAWYVRNVGADQIWSGLRAVGLGLVAIIAIAGLRFGLRAIAWALAVEPPSRLPLSAAFAAVIAGDAVGNLTPLGLLVSEPTKAAFVRRLLPLSASVPALAIENICYTLSVAAMIAASTMALVLTVDLPAPIRHAAWVAVAVIAAGFVVTAWMLWQRPALVSRVASAIVPKSSSVHQRLDHLRDLETQIYTFAVRRPAAFVPIVLAELAFHALGVIEVSVTWWLMQGAALSLVTAFILEGANRLIVVLFKFVPLQLGVAEWGTGTLTQILGYGTATGGTLSIVRKVRVVFWVLIGTGLLVQRGFNKK